MKYSRKLSDTIHTLAFVCLGEKEHLTSARIAESVKTNPAYIRQLMAALKNAGLISNTQGQANACLTKPADEITMLIFIGQWRGKNLCSIWILIPTRSAA